MKSINNCEGNVPEVLFSLFKKIIINKPMYQVINNLPINYDFQSKTKEELKLYAKWFEEDNKGNEEADLIKKSIQVYKTDKYYKIITMYRTESWTYLLGEPVFLLPLDITAGELAKVILEGLNHSRSISESEEDIIRNNNKQSLLKQIKEKSYDNLYKNSTSCNIYVESQEITIEPNIYLGSREGLTTDMERVVKLEFLESKYIDIAKLVIDILSYKVNIPKS